MDHNPFLWRIESKGLQAPSWLYGTMHMGNDRLVALPEVVEKARDGADALYCELAIDKMIWTRPIGTVNLHGAKSDSERRCW